MAYLNPLIRDNTLDLNNIYLDLVQVQYEIDYVDDHGRTGWTGWTGYTGYTGSSGIIGFSNTGIGPRGLTGPTGITGPTGPSGNTGQLGTLGPTGILPGITGNTGSTGYTGHSHTGPSGSTGITGESNLFGYKGYTGQTGPSGLTGLTGLTGYTGETGNTGPTGYSGQTGQSGSDGSKGMTGPTGPTGYKGHTGYTGPVGYRGITGPTGVCLAPTGSAGATGGTGYGNNDQEYIYADIITPGTVVYVDNTQRVRKINTEGDLWISNGNITTDPVINLREQAFSAQTYSVNIRGTNKYVNLWSNSDTAYIRCNMFELIGTTYTNIVEDVSIIPAPLFDLLFGFQYSHSDSTYYYFSVLLISTQYLGLGQTATDILNFKINIELNEVTFNTNINTIVISTTKAPSSFYPNRLMYNIQYSKLCFLMSVSDESNNIDSYYYEYTINTTTLDTENINSHNISLTTNYTVYNTDIFNIDADFNTYTRIVFSCIDRTGVDNNICYVAKINSSNPLITLSSPATSNLLTIAGDIYSSLFTRFITNNSNLTSNIFFSVNDSIDIFSVSTATNPTITLLTTSKTVVSEKYRIENIFSINTNLFAAVTVPNYNPFFLASETLNKPIVKYISNIGGFPVDTKLYTISPYGISASLRGFYNSTNQVNILYSVDNVLIENPDPGNGRGESYYNSYIKYSILHTSNYTDSSYYNAINGVVSDSGFTGSSGLVTMLNSTNYTQSDLITGNKYYVNSVGDITNTQTDGFIGTSLSTSELQLKPNNGNLITSSHYGLTIGDNIYNLYNNSLIIGNNVFNYRNNNILIDLRNDIFSEHQSLFISNLSNSSITLSDYETSITYPTSTILSNIYYDSFNYQLFQSNLSLSVYKSINYPYSAVNWYDTTPPTPNKIRYNYNCPVALSSINDKIVNLCIGYSVSGISGTIDQIDFKLNIYPTDQLNVSNKVIYDFSKTYNDTLIIPMKLDSDSTFYITLLTDTVAQGGSYNITINVSSYIK